MSTRKNSVQKGFNSAFDGYHRVHLLVSSLATGHIIVNFLTLFSKYICSVYDYLYCLLLFSVS